MDKLKTVYFSTNFIGGSQIVYGSNFLYLNLGMSSSLRSTTSHASTTAHVVPRHDVEEKVEVGAGDKELDIKEEGLEVRKA